MRDDPADPDAERGGSHAARLVLFDTGDARHAGRRVRRDRMLALRPIDPTERINPARLAVKPGSVHWEYLLADDSSLLIRVRDFADRYSAARDAREVWGMRQRLRAVYVRDPDSGHLSWWLMHKEAPVLVASRVWLPSQRGAVVRASRKALEALGAQPPWGEYEG